MEIDKQAEEDLQPPIHDLTTHPDPHIPVVGRGDERPTSAYGFTLSGMRAEVARKFLQEHGVKNAITIQGYGKAKPLCFEHNDNCYQLSNQLDLAPEH